MEYGDLEYYQHRYIEPHDIEPPRDIEALLPDEQDFTMDEHSIYKVPPKLRDVTPKLYTPNAVSIGPYHYGNRNLQRMERQKIKHAKRFIKNSEASLNDFLSLLRELEPRVRRCYSEKIELTKEEFIKNVILVDCCFTLQFLLQFLLDRLYQIKDDDDPIKPLLKDEIHWDLLLIENQLHFFVFEAIYNLAFASRLESGDQESFWTLVTFWIVHMDEQTQGSEEYIDGILHFTHLYQRYRLIPSRNKPGRGNKSLDPPSSVKELEQAGVKFKVDEESKCFLDIEFSDGYLTIPKLKVTDRTEMILRNMVAFEQCHNIKDSYFTDYIVFLDFIINKKEDVDILINNEIIVNYLGNSKLVTKMFDKIGKFVLLGNSNTNYLRITKDLNAYCKHPWHSRMATLRRDYFNTPWTTVASVAAIVVIILTITQTVLSFLKAT